MTQKELNVIPNAPRFLRETDTIRFSAKIANLSDAAMDGTARLQLFDAMTMKAIDVELGNVNNNRDFTIEKDGNTSVNWTFRIPLGTQAVTYRVVAAAGNFSDGEENTLPVLSNRVLVSESRALWYVLVKPKLLLWIICSTAILVRWHIIKWCLNTLLTRHGMRLNHCRI